MKVPENYYDEVFEFKGEWGMPSKCGLRIRFCQKQPVVIVTELYQDNPGTSVTGAAGMLLTQICQEKGFSPEGVIYIECNPDTHSVLSFYDEKYFFVSFDFSNGVPMNPTYRQLNAEEITLYIS